MSDSNKCLIVMVLDRSGSMASIKEDTIGGVNTFLTSQGKFPGKTYVTLAQFDTEYEVVYQNQTLETVRPLDQNSFVPRGGTALLDAIGRTLNATAAELVDTPEDQKPGRVYFVIITDGQENSSTQFTRDQVGDKPGIFEMIKHHKEALGFEFVFLGANQDAISVGNSYGIAAGASMSYTCTSAGVKGTYDALSQKMWTSRASGSGLEFDDKDRASSTQQ